MPIELDVIIGTPDYSVDMTAGLATLQGVSDATLHVAETVLNEKLVERHTRASNIRTKLKKSFKGSYGVRFSLEVEEAKYIAKLKSIGQGTLVELIKYFIAESMYQECEKLSAKAEKELAKLGYKADDLVGIIRKSALSDIHKVPEQYNFDVVLRRHSSRDANQNIALFTHATSQLNKAKISTRKLSIKGAITRYNIHTGNGRLLVEGANKTVAFGFKGDYRAVSVSYRSMFSENLDYNNRVSDENYKYLSLTAQSLRQHDETIIKYLLVYADED